MVKKALHITPGIEPLYGTRDENLRLMEDGLNVQIDLRSEAIQVDGEATDVARVEDPDGAALPPLRDDERSTRVEVRERPGKHSRPPS